jgi:hypothetical protein
MKTQNRKNRSIVKGIKLTLLTILLQSTVLGFALVLKANDMLPDDFVNYSGRITNQNSPTDVMQQKASKSKNKAYSFNKSAQNEISSDDQSAESTELTSFK